MPDSTKFLDTVKTGYTFKGECFKIGGAMLEGAVVPGADVLIPLKTMNRHGLIAGATGTGKTKTLQMLAEVLSDASVPVLLMDIKGDLSGIAAAGTVNDKITDRCQKLNIEYKPTAYPVDLLTLSNQKGARLRATVSEFGPVLLSKILGLNNTQGGFVAIIFKYCDDTKMPLLDLKDFIKVLQFVSDEGKADIEKEYGKISTTSTGTILRKVIELQQQGADIFFGEKSFEVDDLLRINSDGKGMISIVRVTDLQDRPKLFSTFMLQLLAELYASCPEEGDMDKPKLVMFIDEAHLIFQEANDALLQQIETIIKLIRSKGIGIYFCTQNPMDVPASVLAQLELKVQHGLRAFKGADRKGIKKIAENYPETNFYKTEDLITQLGNGEALVTMLNEKGIPTPLVHCMIRPPQSRMDILTDAEIDTLVSHSKIAAKYNEVIDSKSAYEILTEKLEDAAKREEAEKGKKAEKKTAAKKAKGYFDDPTVRSMTRTAGNTIIRSLLGVLDIDRRRLRNTHSGEGGVNEFNGSLDLPNHNTSNNPNFSQEFSKQYYDLILDFLPRVNEIRIKLEIDKKLHDKLKDNIKGISISEFIQFCILYDFYQILKIISNEQVNSASLEAFGLLLSSSKIMENLFANSFDMSYEALSNIFSNGIQKNVIESIFKMADINNPLKKSINHIDDEKIFSSKNMHDNLSLPTALKLIDDPLFDEYATTLYRFANIIAKANSTVSSEEEMILKQIFQLTHNPLPGPQNKSLNISEVNEKEILNEVLNELDNLIGLDAVKQEVKSLINYIKIQKEREKVGLKSSQVSYHCVFTGSPGTGKTTIARIIAKIYMHLGILEKGNLVETDRSGLVAEYLGQTAIKVNKTVDSALNGVLFIDEAYSLVGENKDDFGKEAVSTLIKRMEDDRDKLIVILAGYTQEMRTFIDSNPGIKSRFNRYIEFADYSPSELLSIFKLQCSKLDYKLTDEAEKKLFEIVSKAFINRDKSFGNGRFIRNLFEKTIERQANRIAGVSSLTKEILITIEFNDVPNDIIPVT